MLDKEKSDVPKVPTGFWRKLGFYTLMAFLLCRIDGVMAAVADAINRPAIESHLGTHSALLAADYTGDNLIAVGERGLILRSDDEGKNWRQLSSPVSVTLTGVRFHDDQNGYVIGHGGTVLRTTNGGDDWEVMLNGRQLADSLLAQAEKGGDEEAIRQAKFLVTDGPDKPFLDIWLMSADHLVVVGAYGFAFESTDAGHTWVSWMDRTNNDFGLHLYNIRKQGERVLLAGEQGFVAISEDNGETFEALETPYEGSFFTAQLMGESDIVLAGLRGNTFVSHDNGQDWKQIKNPISASIMSSFMYEDGHVLMANQAGILLGLKENRLIPITKDRLPPLTSIMEKATGGVLALSIHGPISIDVGNFK